MLDLSVGDNLIDRSSCLRLAPMIGVCESFGAWTRQKPLHDHLLVGLGIGSFEAGVGLLDDDGGLSVLVDQVGGDVFGC